jgi:hypothetical protein
VTRKYVKWTSHDDLHRPDYLAACVDVLEADPSVVLCQTGTRLIDADGTEKNLERVLPDLDDDNPAKRFSSMVRFPHLCTEVFGVYRTEVFQQTPLLQPFVGSDRALLAEVALRGKIKIVLRDLFLNRRHDLNSIFQYPDEQERVAWFDPSRGGTRHYPVSRLVAEYILAIERARVPRPVGDACLRVVKAWMAQGNHLDRQPVARHLMRERATWGDVAPDDDCPCGTGLKYGQCHGSRFYAMPPPPPAARQA